MSIVFAAIGMVASVAGAIALYLASPNQQLFPHLTAPRTMGRSGMALLALGLCALMAWAGPATSVYIEIALLMATFSLLPPLVAWRRAAGTPAK